ncbi:MAG: MerR family DNA-binding transcriptional regulator [Microthrixaceae bacterium]
MSTTTEATSDDLISIGQLASDTGVSSRTIRYYEELGILPEPPRSPGGTRRYPVEYRFYIEGALALKELGFTLEEIKLLGRMALSQPMSQRQQTKAQEIILDRMESLEHKIKILSRLREVMNDYGSNGAVDPEKRAADLVSIFEPPSTSK